ncbi:MAG: tetratricopeptide repeat protein [Gemmatimonadales bacterium]
MHRYVAGTLELDAVAEFETHLLGCAVCQRAVRGGATVRAALRGAEAGRGGRQSRARLLWWSIPLAAAAGAAWLVIGRESPLARLGRIAQAPTFAGVTVRSDVDSLSLLTDRGIAAYQRGRYRDAARLLGAVPEQERTAGLRFYLGLASLLAGSPQNAARQLAAVSVDSPYAAEAHLYRAKAWLRLGQADSALVELAAVPAGTSVAAHASALADSVKVLR